MVPDVDGNDEGNVMVGIMMVVVPGGNGGGWC